MTEEFERDIMSFLRSLAGECANCFRRNQGYCESCYLRRAKVLLQRLDVADTTDNTALRFDIVSRMARIAAILKKAHRPLLSREIDMDTICSKSLKEFTINTMLRIGKIGRKPVGNGTYVYFLKPNTKKEK